MQKYTSRKDDITSLLGATALENQVSFTYCSPEVSHPNAQSSFTLPRSCVTDKTHQLSFGPWLQVK